MRPESSEDRRLCVLVADADAHSRSRLSTALREAGHRVHTAGDGEEALHKAHQERPDVVFLDTDLPGQGGWLVCAKLKLRGDDSPMVVMVVRGQSVEHLPDAAHPNRFAEFVQADELVRRPVDTELALRMIQELAAEV